MNHARIRKEAAHAIPTTPDTPQAVELTDTSHQKKDDPPIKPEPGLLSDPVPGLTITAVKVQTGDTIILEDPVNATQTRIAIAEASFDKYLPFIVAGTTASAGLLLTRDSDRDKPTTLPLTSTQGNKELSPTDRLVLG